MTRWGITAVLLVLLLLGAGGYLAFQIMRSVLGNTASIVLQNEIFNEDDYPPGVDQLPAAERKVRQAYERFGGWRFGLMLQDIMLLKAWLQPETSTASLRDALELSEKYYPAAVRGGENWAEYAGGKIAWAYLYAGLPARMDSWGQSFLAGAPAAHDSVTLMRIDAAVLRDDLPAARVMAEKEIANAQRSNTSRGMALAASLGIADFARARECAAGFTYSDSLDQYVKHYYASFLMHDNKFVEAKRVWDSIYGDDPEPEDADVLAEALGGMNGLDDADVRRLIELGARSSRSPRSIAGMEAWVAAYMFSVTVDDVYAQRILALFQKHRGDFDVLASAIFAGLSRFEKQYYDESNRPLLTPAKVAGGAGLPPPEELLAALIKAADTPGRRQDAHLTAVSVHCATAKLHGFPSERLARAVAELRCGLGDPTADGAALAQSPADYAGVLQAPAMIEARQVDAQFDAAVNHAVIDYLNRRRALFHGLDAGPPLTYRVGAAARSGVD